MAKRINLNSQQDYVTHMELFPLIKALREKKKIVVIAGAGISAEAGSELDLSKIIPAKLWSPYLWRTPLRYYEYLQHAHVP